MIDQLLCCLCCIFAVECEQYEPTPKEPIIDEEHVIKGPLVEGQIVETESVEVHEEDGQLGPAVEFANNQEGQYQHVDTSEHDTHSTETDSTSKHTPRVKERSKDKSKEQSVPESQAPQAANTANIVCILTYNMALIWTSLCYIVLILRR